MPENYLREMVADWMGSSMAYTGSWDMREWLNTNLPKIRLHSYTREELVYVLNELGYTYSYDMLANRHTVRLVGESQVQRKRGISYGY